MGTLLISLLTLVLLLISAFVILIVLMQRTSQSGGMGAALGGGAAESAFGSETNNILMKGTVYGIVAFFLVALGLYLLYQSAAADRVQEVDMQTLITAGESEGAVEAVEAVAGGSGDVAETLTGVIDNAEAEGTLKAVAESVDGVSEVIEVEAVETINAETEEALPAAN